MKIYLNREVHNKREVKSEVIFLTHNEAKHYYNLNNGISGEHSLWDPTIQENKVSQYGGKNVRYAHQIKAKLAKKFLDLHSGIIPWCEVRYCF